MCRRLFQPTGSGKLVLTPFSAFLRCALRAITLVAVVSTALSTISACGRETISVETLPPIALPLPTVTPDTWAARGTVVSEEPLVDVQPELSAQLGDARHVMYRSVSGTSGAGTVVSGSLFVPKGDPPPAGWPVLSLAHGFTGLNTDCAPSAAPDFRGYGAVVAALLSSGIAVAFTDYEGLGGPGLHPFLEPRTAAFNVIDSVRALKALFPSVSTRWVALGVSQGGQASWAANELNRWYGDGFELLGTVTMAPAANVSGFAFLADQDALTSQQLLIMPAVVVGAQRSYPAGGIDRLLHGEAAQEKDLVIGCGAGSDQARAKLKPADVKPASKVDAAALRESLRKMALPLAPESAPLLVVSGLADELILPETVSVSVKRACDLGGPIQFRELPDKGHPDVGPNQQTLDWILDRFAGKPASTTCPSTS
ncbi:MAG: hypothetical protein QOF47_1412 [Mycobacterium sp.]|nr:hypothetical protein [Mycobacterium sp.]